MIFLHISLVNVGWLISLVIVGLPSHTPILHPSDFWQCLETPLIVTTGQS